MKQFRFLGDPTKYQWDIPLEHGREYAGDTRVFGIVTLEKVIDLGKDPHDPGFEEEWKEVENGKGKFNGVCNVSSCTTNLPATWYNHSTRAYYCSSCAERLNNDPYNKRDALKMFGHDLCTEGKEVSHD